MFFLPGFQVSALGSWDPGGQGPEALGRRGPGPSSTELTMIVKDCHLFSSFLFFWAIIVRYCQLCWRLLAVNCQLSTVVVRSGRFLSAVVSSCQLRSCKRLPWQHVDTD